MIKLIINVAAIFAGLAIFLVIANSSWGKAHEEFQYPIMAASVLAAVIIGGIIQWIL